MYSTCGYGNTLCSVRSKKCIKKKKNWKLKTPRRRALSQLFLHGSDVWRVQKRLDKRRKRRKKWERERDREGEEGRKGDGERERGGERDKLSSRQHIVKCACLVMHAVTKAVHIRGYPWVCVTYACACSVRSNKRPRPVRVRVQALCVRVRIFFFPHATETPLLEPVSHYPGPRRND